MSYVRICDDVLWLSHIDGNDTLQSKIKNMNQGESIKLEIDGLVGKWLKMSDGVGQPTPGIKPTDDIYKQWQDIRYQENGKLVTIYEVS